MVIFSNADLLLTMAGIWLAVILLQRAKRGRQRRKAWEEQSRRYRAREAEVRRQMEGRLDGDAA